MLITCDILIVRLIHIFLKVVSLFYNIKNFKRLHTLHNCTILSHLPGHRKHWLLLPITQESADPFLFISDHDVDVWFDKICYK